MEPDKRIASRGKEPSRLKTHWDYVLEEMAWLAKVNQNNSPLSLSPSLYPSIRLFAKLFLLV
jgi:hypothetical protein